MASNYIIINSKRYKISALGYEPEVFTPRRIRRGLTSKDYSQKAANPIKRWRYRLKVLWSGDATWGDIADLETAEAADYVAFTDPHGNSYNIYFEVPLIKKPKQYANLDGSDAEYLIDVQIRERRS